MSTKILATASVRLCLAVLGVSALACTASATFVHQGQNDPTTEGWALYSSGAVGAGQEAIGGRLWDYWQVNDDSYDNAPFYHGAAPSDVLSDATGWTLTSVLRVNTLGTSPDWPVSVSVDDGASKLWNLQMYNGTGASGAGVYRANAYVAPTLLTAMDVTLGYHIYQLVYDKTADTAAVYVDGTSVASITRAQADGGLLSGEVNFGSITSYGKGSANYAYVAIEAGHHVYSDLNAFSSPVPEPSTIMLLTTGLVGLLAYAWRKRR
jgi:hypothetical protein